MTDQNENSTAKKPDKLSMKDVRAIIQQYPDQLKVSGLIEAAMSIGVDPLEIIMGGLAAIVSLHQDTPIPEDVKEELLGNIDKSVELLKKLIK